MNDLRRRNSMNTFLDQHPHIRQLGLDPIVIQNQTSQGRTITKKIELNSIVGYGVILYTPCDEGA